MDVIEAVARAICRSHRTGSSNMSERGIQETEDRVWEQHVSDAHAAVAAIHDNISDHMVQTMALILHNCEIENPADRNFELLGVLFESAAKEAIKDVLLAAEKKSSNLPK